MACAPSKAGPPDGADRSIGADQADQPALNLDLIFGQDAGLIRRVSGFESDCVAFAEEFFQRGFLIFDKSHHDIAIVSGRGFAEPASREVSAR